MGEISDFNILTLGEGAIINYRNVLIDSELSRYDAIALSDTTTFEITKDKLV